MEVILESRMGELEEKPERRGKHGPGIVLLMQLEQMVDGRRPKEQRRKEVS